MKKILAILLVGTVLLSLSAVGMSVNAGSFEDYYYTPYIPRPLGDTDNDNAITVKDATLIQKHLAKMITIDEYELEYARVLSGYSLSIKDATAIQKFVAKIISTFPIREKVMWNGEETTSVSIVPGGSTRLVFTVEEPAYYEFEAVCDEGVKINSFIEAEDDSYYNYNYGGGKNFCYLQAGTYRFCITTGEKTEQTVKAVIKASSEFNFFDKADAIEAKSGDTLNISADSPYLVKIKNNNSNHTIKIDGDSPNVQVYLANESLSYCSKYGTLNEENSQATVMCSKVRGEYTYLYFIPSEDCSDYSLSFKSYIDEIIASAKEISLSVTQMFTRTFSGYDFSYDGTYKYTPTESGYYKFTLTCENHGNGSCDVSEEERMKADYFDSVCYLEADAYGENICEDIAYLETGKTYYLSCNGYSDYVGKMSVLINASTKEEYDEFRSEDSSSSDESYLNAPVLSVGRSENVAVDNDEDVCWYKLQVEEDGEYVIYSEDAYSAYLTIYDEKGEYIGYFSGSFDEESEYSDITVKAQLQAKEVYYLAFGSYGYEGDFYPVYLVKSSDYTPNQ